MKAVILAAGEGMRMRPLTDDKPKQLVEVAGKPILDYIFEALPPEITEAILVVGYRGDQIKAHYGDHFGKLRLTYETQEQPTGTMEAVRRARPHLQEGERFMVMYADDIHGAAGIKACVESSGLAISVLAVEDPRRFGVVETDEKGRVTEVVEKPEHPRSNLVSTGVFVLDT